MTSVSKKINKLVSNPENDLTAELKRPDFDSEDLQHDDEIELNADTASFRQADIEAGLDKLANASADIEDGAGDATQAALDAADESDTDSLCRPEIDIQKLRAEWAGLEQELSKKFNAEIDQLEIVQLKEKLEASSNELNEREQQLAQIRDEFEKASQEAARLSEELQVARQNDKQYKADKKDLEKKLAAGDKQIQKLESRLEESELRRQKENKDSESRAQELKELKSRLAEADGTLAELREQFDEHRKSTEQVEAELENVKARLEQSESEVNELSSTVKSRDADLERNQSKLTELSKELETERAENDELKSENRELRRIARDDSAKELERSYQTIAEQSGRLAGNAQEISALHAQIERTERYADELRHQLREQSSIAENALSNRHEIMAEAAAAQDKAESLAHELAETRSKNAEMSRKLGSIEKDHEKEMRKLRLELGQAQETIADQETINVELTSDLFSTKGFQKGLESKLEEAREEYEERIRELEQQANKLKNQLDDYEYKLENKDEAIGALMNELTKRSDARESVDEIEDVISEIEKVIDEIDDQQPIESEDTAERERVTRLLIGENDGQELRFPLFKDRLTIGRTAHNDIQLNAQFISRQHAVIVTEDGKTKIVDWGSKNGVLVNEKRVSEQLLENGDIVTIGTTDFRYEERPKR
ncbi:MAG: FHA domain-containing protein [Woeseiaceae bacterium]|nr:FHA domain-containing protein [Woeseiaceae bacterium]